MSRAQVDTVVSQDGSTVLSASTSDSSPNNAVVTKDYFSNTTDSLRNYVNGKVDALDADVKKK